ncbi:MAG: hypothetical protein MUE30_10045 [Spirosomaceae bacterium]|nr:hypothetical protein [Spirosomataceae bacterium]
MNIPIYCYVLLLLVSISCQTPSQKPTIEYGQIPNVQVASTDTTLLFQNDVLYQKGQLFSGVVLEKYANGQVAARMSYLNGKLENQQQKWYPDGTKMEIRYYKDNRKMGQHQGWWPDGRQKFVYFIENDIPVGEHREWHSNGQLYSLATYNDEGQPEGPQKMWYNTGQIKSNFVIKDGRKYGFLGAKGCMGEGERGKVGLTANK